MIVDRDAILCEAQSALALKRTLPPRPKHSLTESGATPAVAGDGVMTGFFTAAIALHSKIKIKLTAVVIRTSNLIVAPYELSFRKRKRTVAPKDYHGGLPS